MPLAQGTTWFIFFFKNLLFPPHTGAFWTAVKLDQSLYLQTSTMCCPEQFWKILGHHLGKTRSRPGWSLPFQLFHLCHSYQDWLGSWYSVCRNQTLLCLSSEGISWFGFFLLCTKVFIEELQELQAAWCCSLSTAVGWENALCVGIPGSNQMVFKVSFSLKA